MSKSNEWQTPPELFAALDKHFKFTLDPCSTDSNSKCARHFTIKENGLEQSWTGESVYMNPPYGQEIRHWMKKAFLESANHGALVVCVVPSRTCTAWWHDHAARGHVRFLRGRVKFIDAATGVAAPAPFPTAVVVFTPFGGRTSIEDTYVKALDEFVDSWNHRSVKVRTHKL